MFLIGAFGIVGLSFAAIFGKVNWGWAASLMLALFILAVGQSVIGFINGGFGSLYMEDTI